MTKEDKQIIDRAVKEGWRTGDRSRLKRLLEKNLKLYRENVELERKLEQTEKDLADYQFNYPKIKELEKENAELKEQNEKWFVFETEAGNWGMDKATQYTVDRHNYFYGTKNECQIWAVEHKIKDYTGHKYCYDRLDDQLEQAKEIIKELIEDCKSFAILSDCEPTSKEIEQAEQFIREIEK